MLIKQVSKFLFISSCFIKRKTKMDENLEEQSESPQEDNIINKRRSSIFQRQSIVAKEKDFDDTNVTEEVGQKSKKIKLQSESFDIEKYIESLKEEDKKWHEVYAKRKARVQELMKREKCQEQPLDYSCLSDSERAFLKARPDYEEFNKNVHQLCAMAKKVTFLNMSAENSRVKSIHKLKSETNSIMQRIINLSEKEESNIN